MLKAAVNQDPELDNFVSRLHTKAKGDKAHSQNVNSYYDYFAGDNIKGENKNLLNNTEEVSKRKGNAQTLTNHFYDMVTDFYEYGWGQSFHFCRYFKGETFATNIARHEDYLALKLNLKKGERCLDVGCGVGGPMREIAKFSGANVVGINNNEYQVKRNAILSKRLGLEKLCSVIKGDFHHMPFPENYFDKAYAIEATCHAQKLEDPYAEVFRTLKPGGLFAGYEWLTTDKYQEDNLEHKKIMLGLEEGNSCPKLVSIKSCLDQLKKVGFEIIEYCDLADPNCDESAKSCLPWYFPLDGFYDTSALNFYYMWAMKPFGRSFTRQFASALETLRIAPSGTTKIADVLNLGADKLVEAGKLEIFTPMFL
ncbi:Delta(24)-sterol C-methyltransferase [Lobulomyces angularis]|nr:Delta(24)-sterol C-methyltransferase [Lobulomyces angularis]